MNEKTYSPSNIEVTWGGTPVRGFSLEYELTVDEDSRPSAGTLDFNLTVTLAPSESTGLDKLARVIGLDRTLTGVHLELTPRPPAPRVKRGKKRSSRDRRRSRDAQARRRQYVVEFETDQDLRARVRDGLSISGKAYRWEPVLDSRPGACCVRYPR